MKKLKLFQRGDRVECVDDSKLREGLLPLKKGEIYTVRECWEEHDVVKLAGIYCPRPQGDMEFAYSRKRFRLHEAGNISPPSEKVPASDQKKKALRKFIAASRNLEQWESDLWDALTALACVGSWDGDGDDAIYTDDPEERTRCAARIGEIIARRISKGDNDVLALAATGWKRVKEGERLLKREGSAPSKKPGQVFVLHIEFQKIYRRIPSTKEFLAFANPILRTLGESEISKSDVSKVKAMGIPKEFSDGRSKG
jgi:hypothetical protein